MVKVILDTSVLIEKIRTKKGCFDDLVETALLGDIELFISSIVLTELWMGESMKFSDSIVDVEKILKPINVLSVDSDMAKLAGKLIRNKEVDGFDAIIAATAMECNAELATLNKKHFKGIKGLKLYDESL